MLGVIKNYIKSGATGAINNLKNYDLGKQLKQANLMPDIPKVEMPEAVKSMKWNVDPSVMKLPAGVTNYMSPLASKAASFAGVKLPSEVGGVPLPKLPDLSSMSSKVDESLSGFGFDTKKLGIRSVEDILKTPDLDALKQVQFDSRIDLNNMPDLTKSLDDFKLESPQAEINNMTKDIPGVDKIDLSKYF